MQRELFPKQNWTNPKYKNIISQLLPSEITYTGFMDVLPLNTKVKNYDDNNNNITNKQISASSTKTIRQTIQISNVQHLNNISTLPTASNKIYQLPKFLDILSLLGLKICSIRYPLLRMRPKTLNYWNELIPAKTQFEKQCRYSCKVP